MDTVRSRSLLLFLLVALSGLVGGALAQMVSGDYEAYLRALAQRESSGVLNKVNDHGYMGLYQMGELALIDAGYYRADGTSRNDWRGTWTGKDGIHSREDFLNSEIGQRAAIDAYNHVQWGYIEYFGLDDYVGQEIGGVTITPAGMLAGAHLVGIGNLRTFLRSGGTVIPQDGNRTPITEYFQLMGGYSVGPVAGGSGGNSGGSGAGSGSGTGGAGTGGTGSGAGAGGGGGAGGGELTSGVVMDPSEAFGYGSSGLAPSVLSVVVISILIAGLLIWAAWVFRGRWEAVTTRNSSFGDFLFVSLRVLVVLSLLTYLLAT